MKNLRRPTILVAVDDHSDRSTISSMTVEMGYPTVSVATGFSSWQTFPSSPAQIVITDWMPQTDRFELSTRIREISGDQCLIMVLSPRDGASDLQRALATGIDDFVAKPLVPEQFRARLLVAERTLAVGQSRRAAELENSRIRWLAGIGQTALTFQHDINNPLTALYGHLEMLQQNATLDAEAADDISSAIAQARRIAAIVSELAAAESPTTTRAVTDPSGRVSPESAAPKGL